MITTFHKPLERSWSSEGHRRSQTAGGDDRPEVHSLLPAATVEARRLGRSLYSHLKLNRKDTDGDSH